MAHWVLALPQEKVYQHARLVLTAALYLLITVTYASGDQRARTQAEVRQLMGRVEAALRSQRLPSELAGVDSGMGNQSPVVHGGAKAQITANDPSVGPVAPAGVQAAPTADEARLRRRLRMLRMYLEFLDAAVQGQHERIGHMQPDIEEMQDALYRDENEVAIWQLVPISWTFVLHYTVRQEGAHLLPRLLATKKLMRWSGSPFAIIKVMQYVAFAALEAGQLRVAYEESRAALDLIEQIAGYALLKGYFALVQVDVLYQWNRLEEARSWLHTLLEDASNWHHLDLLGAGNFYLMQVELARGDWTAAQQALRALEDLVRREHFGTHPGVLPTMQAMWWLAQGQVADAAAWAGGIIYPEGAWDVTLYDAFPIVVRVYFAQRRWGEALALLDRWQRHLDRPAANIRVTITHLAQMLVALHQAGKREEARETATRLFALTEPEGYLRVYLDEGEPMRQALRALGTHHQQDQPRAPSITTYASKLLAALDQEQRRPRHGTAAASATTRETAPQASRDADPGVPIEPLSPQEHRVLRLLVAGQTYTEMAEALVVSLNTIKTQVSSIYRKLGVSRRAEAIARMSDLHLL